ncbi:MAG: hypothetical protein F4112_15565 [Holophagales bacterium]|nr:hypothetical protein [Holophagales bacterium]MYD23070.1 hypothetical protein [Holophagales bacterium]MYI34365.1 hypothetical protein [Holophagales bacterium]
MTDHPDLKRLPRVDASDGFTADVLRRVRTDQARQPAPRLRLAVAAVAVVVVSAAAGAWWAQQSAPTEPPAVTAESIEQLRSEYQELNRELESLRRLAEDTQPFVPVSIDPRTEVLFDLRDIEPLPVSLASTGSRRIQ